ncbi:MAG: 23S rRNA (uracil(1939)-C(5))-methyltransferase RlmD [Oscillospiraceae bacterium]|jgi:23S rRNA (uracil1939-C5)-methyltransferase|nr:23S rRNA (uracil(1939)-C(5))-methyltransferase RlmD [Oscillospiraceae bacterium]
MAELQKNDILTLTTGGYSSEGQGVARADGRVVFIKGAVSGETVSARILKTGKNAAFAKVEAVLEASAERIVPLCPVYGKCGGCDFGHMSYAEELRAKRTRVADAFRKFAGAEPELAAVNPSPLTEKYRNKAVFEVGKTASGECVTGFYRKNSHDIVPCERCLLQSGAANSAAEALRAWSDKHGDASARRLFVRSGERGVQVVLEARNKPRNTAEFTAAVREYVPGATSVMLCVSRGESNVALAGGFSVLYGADYFEDTLCGSVFRLSPTAFYQVNRLQAERLYDCAVAFADLRPGDTALDMYCGAGTITLALAKSGASVYGAEIVPEAVLNARENAERNGAANAAFVCADAEDAAARFAGERIPPKTVVVDPPRKGLAPGTVAEIAAMTGRVVYVSCDPATLARDVKLFAERGFSLRNVKMFDMFPRTAHIECAALLER